MTTSPTLKTVKELAVHEPGAPVLSIHLLTDPRDPANTSHSPAWQIDLRNGLRAIEERLDADGADRDERLWLRDTAKEIEERIEDLEPAERGRSLSFFRSTDGSLDLLLTSQLPLRESVVAWDRRPVIGPLVEIAYRGAPLGLVLVDGDEVRLVHLEGGHASVPEDSVYELELHAWRKDRQGPGGAGHRSVATHTDRVDAHAEKHQKRFMAEAAEAISNRLPELGWQRFALIASVGTLDLVRDHLSQDVRQRIVGVHEGHITGLAPQEVADHLEEEIDAMLRVLSEETVEQAIGSSAASGAGATGVAEVLDALAQGRVDKLVYSPTLEISPDQVGPQVRAALGEVADDMWLERAIEHAVETDAAPSVLSGDDRLEQAGGIVATLRW